MSLITRRVFVEINETFLDPNQTSPGKFNFVFREFADVFSDKLRQVPGAGKRHGIWLEIKTTGKLPSMPFRRLTPERTKIAKRYFQELLDA